jgi:hypothetical protein
MMDANLKVLQKIQRLEEKKFPAIREDRAENYKLGFSTTTIVTSYYSYTQLV